MDIAKQQLSHHSTRISKTLPDEEADFVYNSFLNSSSRFVSHSMFYDMTQVQISSKNIIRCSRRTMKLNNINVKQLAWFTSKKTQVLLVLAKDKEEMITANVNF